MSAPDLLITTAEKYTVRLEDYTAPLRIWQTQHGDHVEVHASYTCEAGARAAALSIGAGSTVGQSTPIRVNVDRYTTVVLHDRPRGLHRREVRA